MQRAAKRSLVATLSECVRGTRVGQGCQGSVTAVKGRLGLKGSVRDVRTFRVSRGHQWARVGRGCQDGLGGHHVNAHNG